MIGELVSSGARREMSADRWVEMGQWRPERPYMHPGPGPL